ncbi:NOL1/NOP2/sun family protein [Babesia caballi]|uniref:NOL1/NOP2/sun family protein n=1 Tax=Babesia caballi TaxID=5871 RepID=A0AAV4M0K0_BABCB|nr:NOL1/NOP2/sun family protein [Babesia caballi]
MSEDHTANPAAPAGSASTASASAAAEGDKPRSNRLGWRSRCREMQGISRRRKANSEDAAEGPRSKRVAYSDATASNADFDRYYRDQRICPEEQWDAFRACCQNVLPISFRINTCVPLWRRTIRQLISIGNDHTDLGLSPALRCTRDVPELDAGTFLYYQLAPDKASLRKNEQVVRFRRCLIDEDNRGAISRQETVSMLPVIYLDPQPHENILDLCAAPGMKFLQIVDAVQSALHYRHGQPPCANRGLIIGNDVCQQRVSTLSHNVKAVNCPSAAVTNFDASRFPYLFSARGEKLLFDRILADVPCSCDGTIRKAPEIFSTWKPTSGLHMHRMQLTIVKRAMQLLKPGGTLIYSTCSLNPLENEAIASYVASEGRREHGMELQPLEPLPGFKSSPGLLQWLVPQPDGGYYESFDEVPDALRGRVTASMFRAPEWDQQLARCVMRVLPHDNDTGGFFLFKAKKATTAPVDQAEASRHEIKPLDIVLSEPNPSWVAPKRGAKLLHEYIRCRDASPELFDVICDFYGIEGCLKEDFSRLLITKRHCRNNCYLLGDLDSAALFQRRRAQKASTRDHASNSQATKTDASHASDANVSEDALQHEADSNGGDLEGAHDGVSDYTSSTSTAGHKSWERCKYAQLGIRAFARLDSKATLDSPCGMRISQESTLPLLQFMRRRVVLANMAFCAEFVKGNILPSDLLEHERVGNVNSLDSCRRDGVLTSGGCIFVAVPAWGRNPIPARGVAISLAKGITLDSADGGDSGSQASSQVAPVPDILETLPLSCVLSQTGSLFAYASDNVMAALRAIVNEL